MTPDHGLSAVVDNRTRDAAEMGEPSPVTIPKRREIHAGGETAKRISRMAEHHVERVHSRDADMGEQITLITPVDLSLRARDDLEPAMQTAQQVVVGLGSARPRSAAWLRPGTS